jgi:hypothetical protein
MENQLNNITSILVDTMQKLTNGDIKPAIGYSISQAACQAIKASTIDSILKLRQLKEDNKSKHIKLQYDKLIKTK